MQLGEILTSIRSGDLDGNLRDIERVLVDRQKVIGAIKFESLKVGDKVHFNDNVKKNLAGLPVTVVEKRRTNVLIETEDGTQYVGNPSLLNF